MRMTAETNDDGTRAYARLRREDGQLVVEGSKSGRYVAPEVALAATHWNVAELSGPMINPQNGELLRPRVANRGETALATDAATPVRATHYALSGDVALDLWYDMDLTWQALAFSGSDGSLVRYERLS